MKFILIMMIAFCSINSWTKSFETESGRKYKEFSEKFPDIKIDYGTSNIYRLMKNSKIVVSTSLSTSYLETLSMNIPTIIVTNFLAPSPSTTICFAKLRHNFFSATSNF